jgi:hypothetical protein
LVAHWGWAETFGLQCGNYRPSGRLFCLSSVASRWCLCDVCLKPVPVPVPHLFLMYSLSQCSPPCGWTPHKYIPSSLYGLDTSVYSLPLCLCGLQHVCVGQRLGDRFVRLCDWVCVLGTGQGNGYTRLSEAPVVDRLAPCNH